ncbi:MAG TPA: hypothetical protein VFA65_09815 [Bryobacteraceae bacterium]|nr:hypothetical protein [Bryobacteraceae bacterium]
MCLPDEQPSSSFPMHFTVDGVLIDAWASEESFRKKNRRIVMGRSFGASG